MKTILLSLCLFCTLTSYAQTEATTTDGKKILVYPDGTWKVATEGSDQIARPVSIFYLELPKSRSQDQIITHTGYTLSYNKTYHIANWVAYELTAEETESVVERSDKFVPDPQLKSGSASNKDYKNSGYERGHLAPAADMGYSYQTMAESFYLSNMSPQEPGFNRGIWSKLEKQVRQWAIDDTAVYVVTGTVLTEGLPAIGSNAITVPRYFYKVILDYTMPEINGIGFILPNQGSQESLQHYAVTIDSVERFTGTDFFYQLPDDQEKVIESTIDLSKWSWPTNKTHSSNEGGSQSVRSGGSQKQGFNVR